MTPENFCCLQPFGLLPETVYHRLIILYLVEKWPWFYEQFDPTSEAHVSRLAGKVGIEAARRVHKSGFNKEDYQEILDEIIEPFAFSSGLEKVSGSVFNPDKFMVRVLAFPTEHDSRQNAFVN